MDAPLTGVVPVVPTIFHDDQTVDLDGTARVVDYLMDAGVAGLCLLANYSEQFSLSDAERDAIARTLLERVAESANFAAKPPGLERPFDGVFDLIERKRLCEVIVCARLHRGDGALDGRVCGHQDYHQVRVARLYLSQ